MYEYIIEFFTLSLLEVVLNLDNVIFISILVEKLPNSLRKKVRFSGITIAVILRIILLFSASAVMKMSSPIFTSGNFILTGQKLLLILGGMLLIFKGSRELYLLIRKYNKKLTDSSKIQEKATPLSVILQIIFIDLVLSLDSIITAVGLTQHMYIIIASILVSLIFMLTSVEVIDNFIDKNPSIKILALNFIVLLGIFLTLSGFGITVSKNYLYFAMGFACFNEYLMILIKRK